MGRGEYEGTNGEKSGAIRRKKVRLFEGKPNERVEICGEVLVKGDSRFTSTIVTPFGPDDAKVERAKAKGQEPPPPHYEVVADATKRSQRKLKERMAARRAEDGAPASPIPSNPPSDLAKMLEGFEDDPEMQAAIFARWQKKQAAKAGTAVVAAEAVKA